MTPSRASPRTGRRVERLCNHRVPRGAFESASLALSADGLAATYASKSQDFFFTGLTFSGHIWSIRPALEIACLQSLFNCPAQMRWPWTRCFGARSRRVRQLRRPSLGLPDCRARVTSRRCSDFRRKPVVRPAEAGLPHCGASRTMFGVGALAPTPNPVLKAFHIVMTTGAGEGRSSCSTS